MGYSEIEQKLSNLIQNVTIEALAKLDEGAKGELLSFAFMPMEENAADFDHRYYGVYIQQWSPTSMLLENVPYRNRRPTDRQVCWNIPLSNGIIMKAIWTIASIGPTSARDRITFLGIKLVATKPANINEPSEQRPKHKRPSMSDVDQYVGGNEEEYGMNLPLREDLSREDMQQAIKSYREALYKNIKIV